MVNFGTYLVSFRNPAWAAEYLDYESLKALIYALKDELATVPDDGRTKIDADFRLVTSHSIFSGRLDRSAERPAGRSRF